MSVIEYYKRILTNLGMVVDDQGYLYIMSNDDKVLLCNDGKPMVLPTSEHMNSIYQLNEETGEMEISKLPFNPLNEDVIKGDSQALKRLKSIVELRLGHVLVAIGESLLILASNKALQTKTNLEISKFLGEINKAQNQGIKQLVDDKTIDSWAAIYANVIKKGKGALSIFLKKKGTINGQTYTRLAVASSEIYDELMKADKDTPVFGVKLRNKDLIIFRIIFTYILQELNDDGTLSFGSNDTTSPAFLSLMNLAYKLLHRFNKLWSGLKTINTETYDSYFVKDLMSIEEVNDIQKFHTELLNIPSELDLNRGMVKSKLGSFDGGKLANTTTPVKVPQTPFPNTVVPLNQQQSSAPADPLMKALYGGTQQPPMNTQVQPMGINSMMHQPVQQPIMNVGFNQPIGVNSVPVMQQPMGINAGYPNISAPGSYYQQPAMGFPMQQPVQQMGVMPIMR